MKINKFTILSIIFVIIAICISFFGEFFRDFLDDSIIIFMFYIFGIVGVILALIALRHYKRESNKFSIYSVFLVTLIVATVLFLIVMPPCQCGSRAKAREARIQAALYQVRTIATQIHEEENSYASLCDNLNTLNDKNFNYGSQLKILEDDITLQLKAGKKGDTKPACFASTDSYCASAMLIITVFNREDYYCVDSTGFASRVSKPCYSADKCPAQ